MVWIVKGHSKSEIIRAELNPSLSPILPRGVMLARYMLSSCVRPSVCLSVRPSVTCWYCTKTAKPRITKITPTIAEGLSLSHAKNIGEIPTASPPTGAPNRGGVDSGWRFSTNFSLYLRNGARYGHSYYETLIGIRMCSIDSLVSSVERESQPVCDHCKCHLTVKHMLLECPSTAVIRHKYFSSTTLKELFSKVDARCILDFTKESGFYQVI